MADSKTVVVATGNAHKVVEIEAILSRVMPGVRFVALGELGDFPDPEENGADFYENALIKARAAQEATGLELAVADDSGLCVDALGGAPGIYSARWAGEHGNDEKNNELLLENLSDIPESRRTARFVSTVCCCFPDGRHMTVRGECEGKIAFEPKGEGGFGYDPLFIPDECGVGKTDKRPNSEGRSYAQLTPDEKDAISHRGNALAEMEKELPEFLAEN